MTFPPKDLPIHTRKQCHTPHNPHRQTHSLPHQVSNGAQLACTLTPNKDKDGKHLGIDYSDDATESPEPSRKHAKKM